MDSTASSKSKESDHAVAPTIHMTVILPDAFTAKINEPIPLMPFKVNVTAAKQDVKKENV